MRQLGKRPAMVEIDARLDTQPEVKASAAGTPCRSASSASSSSDRIVSAGNVAGSTRPCPVGADRLDRGFNDVGMAAHAEIVVRTPDRHFARPVASSPSGAIGRSGTGARRARDWRWCGTALPPSGAQSPPRSSADSPSPGLLDHERPLLSWAVGPQVGGEGGGRSGLPVAESLVDSSGGIAR